MTFEDVTFERRSFVPVVYEAIGNYSGRRFRPLDRPIEVGEDVRRILGADGQPYQIGSHAARSLLVGGQLAVGGARIRSVVTIYRWLTGRVVDHR